MKNTVNYVEKININEFVSNLNIEEFNDFLELWYQGQHYPVVSVCNTEVWNAANCIYDDYCFDEDSSDEEFEEAKYFMIRMYEHLILEADEFYGDEWFEMNIKTFNEIFEEWFDMYEECAA